MRGGVIDWVNNNTGRGTEREYTLRNTMPIDNVSFTHSLTCPSPWTEREERELPFLWSMHVTAVRGLVIMKELPPAREKQNVAHSGGRGCPASARARRLLGRLRS